MKVWQGCVLFLLMGLVLWAGIILGIIAIINAAQH